ncbi:MAG: metallophosphoesterase [Deltaproteobacteria bacterium]|jgi:predicted MPP superfamily phosphohydrolase|nr:metallophosphoesterase [Deltaproteobacteria bacterium]
MFISFGVVIAGYVILSLVLFLPVKIPVKIVLAALVALGASRLAIMRRIFGGLGGIEAPRWLLLGTSYLQGLLVVLFLILILRDVLTLGSFLGGIKRTAHFRSVLRSPEAAVAMVLAAAVIGLAGLYGAAKVPEVKREMVALPRWPQELDGLKVAVLADMHISKFFDRGWVESVVERTNAEKPDMIWMPGDMVDGTTEARAPDVAPLAELSAPYGVYASLGNHEYISRVRDWLPVFKNLGIEVLQNAHVTARIGSAALVVAGVNDQTAQSPRYNMPGPDLGLALAGAPPDLPVVLLDHRPGRAPLAAREKNVIFQISGHTHGGMMPILKTMVARANGGYLSGFYDVGSMKLFVAPGLGLWSGFPMRLLTPSEITILTIRSGSPAG